MFTYPSALKYIRQFIDIEFYTEYDDSRATLDGWRATKYEGKVLSFVANFTFPEDISNFAERDELHLTITSPEVFISMENGLSLDGKLDFKLSIDPLLEPPTGAGAIMGAGRSLAGAGVGQAVYSFSLNLFLQYSL